MRIYKESKDHKDDIIIQWNCGRVIEDAFRIENSGTLSAQVLRTGIRDVASIVISRKKGRMNMIRRLLFSV